MRRGRRCTTWGSACRRRSDTPRLVSRAACVRRACDEAARGMWQRHPCLHEPECDALPVLNAMLCMHATRCERECALRRARSLPAVRARAIRDPARLAPPPAHGHRGQASVGLQRCIRGPQRVHHWRCARGRAGDSVVQRGAAWWVAAARHAALRCKADAARAGDQSSIMVGVFSSIGDRAVITAGKHASGAPAHVQIGNHVNIGAPARLQARLCAAAARSPRTDARSRPRRGAARLQGG